MGCRYKKYSGVYLILNIITKKVYIGSSKSMKKRFSKHRNDLRNNKHYNKQLQEDWNVYGEHIFVFKVIDEYLDSELLIKEALWINHYNSLNPELGYNHMITGEKGTLRKSTSQARSVKLSKNIICINITTREVIKDIMQNYVASLNLKTKPISKVLQYWRSFYKDPLFKPSQGESRSTKGYLFMSDEIYDRNFDYVNHKKARVMAHKEPKMIIKKDIIPYAERNIKRKSIIAHEITTGHERVYTSVSECITSLNLTRSKVRLAIKLPFKQRSNKGYWFRLLQST